MPETKLFEWKEIFFTDAAEEEADELKSSPPLHRVGAARRGKDSPRLRLVFAPKPPDSVGASDGPAHSWVSVLETKPWVPVQCNWGAGGAKW